MLMTLRILRGIVGFIAIWQIIGLLPVLTNWLPNANATTGNMWAIAFVKFLVLLICSAAFYWLGRIKNKYENPDDPTTELPAIGLALAAVLVVGVVAAFIIPNLSKQSAQQSTITTSPLENRSQTADSVELPEPRYRPQPPATSQTAQISSDPAVLDNIVWQPEPQPQQTTPASSTTAMVDRRFQRKSVGVDYTTEHNSKCWERYQNDLAKIPVDAPLGDYARHHESAQKQLDNCVTTG